MQVIVGLIDLIGGLLLALSLVNFKADFYLTLIIGAILLAKSIYNAFDENKIHSIIDLAAGVLLVILAFFTAIPFTWPIALVVSIFLLAKGLFVVVKNLVS